VEFEWDAKKAIANRAKHGVSFHEAATVFGDPLAITFPDPDHSKREQRFLTFGHSKKSRLLAIVHTERAGRTRIVSARKATRHERIIYEND
jgi:hypothetical protein